MLTKKEMVKEITSSINEKKVTNETINIQTKVYRYGYDAEGEVVDLEKDIIFYHQCYTLNFLDYINLILKLRKCNVDFDVILRPRFNPTDILYYDTVNQDNSFGEKMNEILYTYRIDGFDSYIVLRINF